MKFITYMKEYLNDRPILTGLFVMLATVALGMSIAFATGLTTPSQVYAQVVGPPCCVPPPPAPAPTPVPAPPPPAPTPVPPSPPVVPIVVPGCTDPSAINYNPNATINDGSCKYPLLPSNPVPTCTLSASPASIASGGSSTLTWTTTNADAFTIDHSVGTVTPAAGSSRSVSPSVTTTYTGAATGSGGTVHCSATVTITSAPPPSDNPSCTLAASPTQVSAGGRTTLTWTAINANTFSIDQGIGSVSPAVSGSVSSGAITTTPTFTGTVTSPTGRVATCAVSVTIGGGGSGGGGPTCTMTVSPTSTRAGNSATLAWGGSEILNVDIDQGIAAATTSPGSATVAPAGVGTHTYTGIFRATNGQTLTCSATLTIEGGSGGGGGGGGGQIPNVVLGILPHVATQPLAYLYLSQIPYTGLDLGPVGTVIYWIALVGWSIAIAYLALFEAAPFAYRRLRAFSVRVSERVNDSRSNVAAPIEPTRREVFIEAKRKEREIPEAPRGYSSYDGFKSFARDEGGLSVEDIVKGLSHGRPARVASPVAAAVEPIVAEPKPASPEIPERSFVRHSDAPAANEVGASVRGFVAALLEGDRTAVFSGLRQHVRGGGSPERLLDAAARLLDEAYRARVDGTFCDDSIARLAARFPTPVLERIVAAIAIAIDSSYTDGVTGAKLALTRALAVVGRTGY